MVWDFKKKFKLIFLGRWDRGVLFMEVLDFFDVANEQDGLSQLSCRSKQAQVKKRGGHLKWVRNGLGQSGYGSGFVRSTRIFHMNFFFKKIYIYIYFPFGK